MADIELRSPATGELIKRYAVTEASEIATIMDKARAAFLRWCDSSFAERAKLLRTLREVIVANCEDIVSAICASTGKVRVEALMADILPTLDILHYYEKEAAKILSPRKARTPIWCLGARSYMLYKPMGVILVIAPWNYPFQLAMVPVITAIAAGNAVILKPSEVTLNIGEKIAELCQAAGVLQNLVQVVYGAGETGRQLIAARPDKIFFTGSSATGKRVMAAAAEHLIPLQLELGGKDPMLVFSDANFKRAVKGAVYGAFANSGQVCVAVERLYVQDTIFDKFVAALVEKVKEVRVGSGFDCDMGPLTFPHQAEVIEENLKDAADKGAVFLLPPRHNGYCYEPVVMKNVRHDMKVMQIENFGPVLPVMPFTSEDEAVALANDTVYGLGSSVWTQDLAKAKRVAARLKAGNCFINDVIKNVGNGYLPFGGIRQSGFGKYHGAEGLYGFSHQMSVMLNSGRLSNEINWFPYSQEMYATLKTMIDGLHGKIGLRTIKGLWRACGYVRKKLFG
jgi:acyl-CoA reductase-like NAD-dependent aldehyde dehydrogenase